MDIDLTNTISLPFLYHLNIWNYPLVYPLVNVYITMGNYHAINGKTHDFDWASFNSYVTNSLRVPIHVCILRMIKIRCTIPWEFIKVITPHVYLYISMHRCEHVYAESTSIIKSVVYVDMAYIYIHDHTYIQPIDTLHMKPPRRKDTSTGRVAGRLGMIQTVGG